MESSDVIPKQLSFAARNNVYFLLLAILLIVLFLPNTLYSKTVLQVGVYNNKPTIFVDADGEVKGLFVDIIENIASQEDWQLEYVPGHFSDLLQSLKEGKIDLMPAIAFSAQREKYIDFNYTTVMANWAELYSPLNNVIATLTQLEGKKIAVKAGDIHFQALKKMVDAFNISCRFFEADEYETVFEMLHASYVDIGVVNRLFGNRKKKDYNIIATPIIFNPIEMRYAVPQGGNEEVLGKIDNYLTVFKNDQDSIYYKSINRWFVLDASSEIPGWLWRIFYLGAAITLFLMGSASLFRYQVKRRTNELIESNKMLEGQIEERKKIEEELRKVARVVEASSDAMALFDREHRHIFVNSAYRSLLAATEKDLSDVSIVQLFGVDYFNKELKEAISNCLQGNVVQFQTETTPEQSNDGYWNMAFSPYHSTQNSIDGYVLDIHDVTEQVELESRLKNAHKMEAVGMLAGGVAHDLNNILSGLVSYPDMLLLDRKANDPITKPLQIIKNSGERAAAIVKDLLTLARREVGEVIPLNLNNIVDEFLVSPGYEEMLNLASGVEVVSELDEDLLNISGSSVHLLKIIMNLFNNAIEAMPEGGLLNLSTENCLLEEEYIGYEIIPAGEYVIFSIEDTGVGMSNDEINRIFEPFYSRKNIGRSGTGLGMSVVWGAIKDHNGYIDIKSTRGGGTQFKIFFPITKLIIKEIENTELQNFKGNGQRVLVVDDIEEQRILATQILNHLGYVVYSAASGEEAVEICKTTEIDLLILDMIMPGGMDGFSTYKKICTFKPSQKAIIASGYSDRSSVKRAQELGAGEYIKKPYTVESIARAVFMELHP